MKVFRLKWMAAVIVFLCVGHFSATAQGVAWEEFKRQVGSKEVREDPAREFPSYESETARKKHEWENSLPVNPRLKEWMRNDPNFARKPVPYWLPLAMIAASGGVLWVIWRARRRILGIFEDAIVWVGAWIVRFLSSTRAGLARIGKRIVDRAEETRRK